MVFCCKQNTMLQACRMGKTKTINLTWRYIICYQDDVKIVLSEHCLGH